MVKFTSWVRPKDVLLRMRPFALHIGPYEDVLRTSGRFSVTSPGRPRDVILPSGTSLYFFTSFLKTNLFWFLILLAFEYELRKPLIINNIEIPCHNMAIMIIHKGIVLFITATFNWIKVFSEFINFWMKYKLFTIKKGWSNTEIDIKKYHGNIKKVKIRWKIITHFLQS